MGSSGDDGYRLLNEYTNGFMVSQVLFAACELGVFDLLAEAPGPLDVAAVAAGVEASSHGTELLLDTCVSLKLLKVETRAGKAFYQNTELSSAYLTRVSPTSQCNLLKYMGRTSYGCWGHLADAVREGKNQYLQTFGVPAEDLFTAIYRSEGERLQFMQALQEVWSVNGRSVLTAFDLSGFPLMCDLGGDFFKDPLPEADLYILARILHDWADGKCSHLLERVYHTCKPGGGILVIESLLDEDRRGPLLTQLYSLNMLVQTEGQERTPTHYHMLLSSAGFRDFQFKKTGAIYDAILVRK
ncbi:acetylserotonin O-methyltransferase isoform X3 [Macaca thibetana thibetana]|uniref:acetylserotonin O-methyltransferase isoform X3 n=1 Tax=Macaca thibetana thibetana TaxID=257877 RepID=UPI0021BC9471|nr:acetylserotonin O-methyltransferase isoform X3 [Macaca thibetana thibetana]XP_050633737.1 acetylserotonin O-methyltransferase isoform X3 [Macaca thibetana thibetana]